MNAGRYEKADRTAADSGETAGGRMTGAGAAGRVFFAAQVLLASVSVFYLMEGWIEELFPLIAASVWLLLKAIRRSLRNVLSGKCRAWVLVLSAYLSFAVVTGITLWESSIDLYGRLRTLVCFAGLWVLLYYLLAIPFCRLVSFEPHEDGRRVLRGRPGKKLFFLLAAGIFLCFLPALLSEFPGVLIADSVWQWNQAAGYVGLSDHHPVLHTMVIRAAQRLCGLLYGELIPARAVCIYSLFQMAVLALIFSAAVMWMYRLGVPLAVLAGGLLYYAVFPLNPLFSVYMTKDILFSAFVLLLTGLVLQLYSEGHGWAGRKRNLAALLAASLLVMFFRSNGVLAVLALFPCLILINKRERKHLAVVFAVLIVALAGKGILCSRMGVVKGELGESLGVPINQIANAVVQEKPLTEGEKAMIEAVIPLDVIREVYSPVYSDPIKFNEHFNAAAIEADKAGYAKLWAKLFLKYPAPCIEATLRLTIGYWYPGVSKGAVSLDLPEKGKFLREIGAGGEGGGSLYNWIIGVGVRKDLLLSWSFSIGNMVFLMLFFCAAAVAKRGWRVMQVFLPNLLVWGTLLAAAPSYCETRYAYSIFLAMPLYVAVVTGRMKRDGGMP